jgi:hypothetical protein
VSYFGTREFSVEASLGNVSGYATINKFGETLDADAASATDVWDGADSVPTGTKIWVPPTTARLHDLVSTSTNDITGGSGLRTLRVYGLPDWDTAEASEDRPMNGMTDVETVGSYVIIHRMKGVSFGSGKTNAGIITATAQTDTTVTAAIQAGEGQTLMAIYGVPSTQSLRITRIRNWVVGTGTVTVKGTLLVMENAGQSDAGWLTKERWRFSDTHSPSIEYDPPKSFAGPCIVKIQVVSDTANSNVASGFDAYLVDN